MKRHFKYLILFSIIIVIILFFKIFYTDTFHKKEIFYTNLDFNIKIPLNTRIYYGAICVGRISTISFDLGKKEQRIEFYLYKEYIYYIARSDSSIIFKVDDINNIKLISITTNSTEPHFILPGKEYINSIIER